MKNRQSVVSSAADRKFLLFFSYPSQLTLLYSLPPANQGELCETCRGETILGQLSEFKGKTSTKISEAMAILDIIDTRSGSTDKTVIVSDSTQMLDLVKPFLEAKGKGYVDCVFSVYS